MKFIKNITLLLTSLIGLTAFSQNANDFGIWSKVNLEHKLNDKFVLNLSEGIRLKENASRLNSILTEIGLDYKLVKRLKTGITYRTLQKFEKGNYFTYRHRIAWDINYKYVNGRLALGYRHRVQSGVKKYFSSRYGKIPYWDYRHRLQLKYEYNKRLEPFVMTELNIQLYNPKQMQFNNQPRRLRYQIGTDINLNAKSSISVYYMIQDEFNTENELDQYLIGLEYSLKF